MIKHILVAVGAHRDDAVLQTAIDKARQMGARLTAVYVDAIEAAAQESRPGQH